MGPVNKVGLYHRQYNDLVCIFDIDGVLNSYPDCWVEFVNMRLGTNFCDLNSIKKTLSYEKYKNLKEEYRESGIKAELKPDEDAFEVLMNLIQKSFKVIIMTARPVEEYPCLYEMTRSWLDKNNLMYSGIVFSRKKQYDAIIQFPTSKFIVEDNRKTANLLAKFGFKVYLKNNSYNQGEVLPNVVRIDRLTEIGELKW